MSLTYSMNRPRLTLSRTMAIALIVLLHAAAFVAFNNGIGKYFKNNPPDDLTIVDVKPDPPPPNQVPVPEPPKPPSEAVVAPPLPDPTPVVIDVQQTEPPAADSITAEQPADNAVQPLSRITVLHRVDPAYPANAEAAGEQGTVLLAVQIDSHGNVVDISVIQSSGFDALDTAAIKAVRQWHFAATDNGIRVRVPIKFQLNLQKH